MRFRCLHDLSFRQNSLQIAVEFIMLKADFTVNFMESFLTTKRLYFMRDTSQESLKFDDTFRVDCLDSLCLLFQIRHHVKKSFTVNLFLTFHGARPTRSSTNLCERNHGFDVTPIWFIDKETMKLERLHFQWNFLHSRPYF